VWKSHTKINCYMNLANFFMNFNFFKVENHISDYRHSITESLTHNFHSIFGKIAIFKSDQVMLINWLILIPVLFILLFFINSPNFSHYSHWIFFISLLIFRKICKFPHIKYSLNFSRKLRQNNVTRKSWKIYETFRDENCTLI
jgi:hypothetical protein